MTRIEVNDVLVDDNRLQMSLFMNFSRDLADFTGDMIVQLRRGTGFAAAVLSFRVFNLSR